MTSYSLLSDAQLSGKRVLLRAGFDVPIKDGIITDETRIEVLVPTMRFILDAGASLVIMAHQGRPKKPGDPSCSQKPLIAVLKKLLGTSIGFAPSCTGEETLHMAQALKPGEVLLLENLRYDEREKKNDPEFATELAQLGEVYVNDAFTNCHREHASMVGIPKLLPAYMGLQLEQEVLHLEKITKDPVQPLTLIVSGAKMETKVPVIKQFLSKGQNILVGGAIANTFIAARGHAIGSSLCDEAYVEQARELLLESEREDMATIHVPRDAVVATELSQDADAHRVSIEDIPADSAIYDIGPETASHYAQIIKESATAVWNGPLGVTEFSQFAEASKTIAVALREMTTKGGVSVLGGGDTLEFLEAYSLAQDDYTFVSTGGGAMLSFLAGEAMPAIDLLTK